MNKISLILFTILLISCDIGKTKFVRKHITDKDISIKWYYHSYITNNSPDFVVVEKGGIEKEIYKATRVILNVRLNGDSIILKLIPPSEGTVFTKEVQKEVFGYKIFLDSTGTYDEFRYVPEGKD